MDETIQVTLAANAGVLLSYKGRKLLIDGLFHAENVPYSNLPEASLEAIYENKPPYDGIDYLIFTHRHPDHFSRRMVKEYLERNKVRGVLLPPSDRPELTEFQKLLHSMGVRCMAIPVSGSSVITPEPDISLKTIPTKHLDRRFYDVPHASILIKLGEKNVLFTGDADYTTETFGDMPPLHAVFLNPLFFHAYMSGRFFKGGFKTGAVCVYHVPFPEDDVFHIRASIAKDMEKYHDRAADVYVLDSPDQQIIL